MAISLPTINVIKPDIENLSIYIRSVHKWGKSTLFRDVVLAKYGDPSYGLSVSCGVERGGKMLDSLNELKVETYTDAMDLKKYLINKIYVERDKKGKVVREIPIEHNIRMVSFDVVDELFPAFEEETIRISNIENPNKKVKTINAAMNGRHNGQFYTANLVKEYMNELIDAGFGVWAIAHSKMKTIKEKGASTDEEGYNQLTSSLMSTYDSVFADIFDVILTGVIDREIEEKRTKDSNGDEVVKRYATDEIRKLYFRGTTLIDAGGRFAFNAVPEYMVFDKPDMAEEFIRVVEEGMEKSKKEFSVKRNLSSKITSTTIKAREIETFDMTEKNEEDSEMDLDLDFEVEVEDDYPEDLAKVVQDLFKTCKDKELKASVRSIASSYGKFDKIPLDELKNLYDQLKGE